jgi:hypothetical protein
MQQLTANTKVYNTMQLYITGWLRRQLNMEYDAPVYFDDADLVYIDKTVVPNALDNKKLTLDDLRIALEQHIATL